MMIAIVTLIYALSKAHHVQQVNGQTISMYEVEQEYKSKDNPLNLNDRNIRMAFRFVEGLYPYNAYNDPQYVRPMSRIVQWDQEGDLQEKILPIHECTDEDYD